MSGRDLETLADHDFDSGDDFYMEFIQEVRMLANEMLLFNQSRKNKIALDVSKEKPDKSDFKENIRIPIDNQFMGRPSNERFIFAKEDKQVIAYLVKKSMSFRCQKFCATLNVEDFMD